MLLEARVRFFIHARSNFVPREFHRRNYSVGSGAQLRSEFQAPRQCLSLGKIVLSITTVPGFGYSLDEEKSRNRRANVSSSSLCLYRIAPLPQKLIIFSSSYLKPGRMLSMSATGR